MFCPNCGESLPDDSKFCGSCGANLSELVQEAQNETPGQTVPGVPTPGQSGFVQPKKQKNTKKLIGIGIAAIVIIVAAFIVKGVLSSSGSNAYVYLSNGKYELITNLNKDTTIEIASSKSDSTLSNLLAFSPDGKYVYYYTKYDSYSGTGSLCRAEFGKLKENSSKNDNYIEVIATNASLGFRFMDNGAVTYVNGDDTLYYYDGKTASQVAKSVAYYSTDGSSRIIYTTGNYSDGYTLYGVTVQDLDSKIKLAANYSYLCDATDFDNILYVKNDDDYNETLYVVGFSKDSEKLEDNVNILVTSAGTVYYTAENGTVLSLYDYVEDTYQSADAGISEPDKENFSIPKYSYYTLNSDSNPNDYDVLYTSCTKPVAFFRSYFSLEYAAKDYPSDQDTYQAFVDKYLSQEDEDGYIVVTDAVRSDLQSLAKTCGQGYEGEWLELCFYKEQTGTTYDYDAYNAACDVYNEAKSRINIREKLQDSENAYPVLSLYCYDKGVQTLISDNVLNCMTYSGGILFNTTDLVTETLQLENVSSTSEITNLFAIDYEVENYVVSTSGTTAYQMSAKSAETLAEANESGYVSLYMTDSNVYMSESNGGLSMATVSNGVVGNFTIITDDARVLCVDDSTLYYAEGTYTNNNCSYCDLYSCTKGESKRLAQDIMLDTIYIYSDNVILAYTDYRSSYGYELTMIASDGTKTLIADDVTQFIRADKSTLLYISDGDLYSYNGKGKTMIRTDADWIWTKNAMEIAVSLGDYNDAYGY